MVLDTTFGDNCVSVLTKSSLRFVTSLLSAGPLAPASPGTRRLRDNLAIWGENIYI